MLERLELNIQLSNLSQVHGWVHQTLQTINSPLFNEFVVWVLGAGYPWSPRGISGWKAVDELLDVLAGRNPDFKVVFKGDLYSFLHGDYDGVRSLIESYLPLVSSKGLVKFQHVPRAENSFGKLGVL